jgi:radical SAM superfamily enzyme YgiQ (UPF0313 family)
MKITLVMPGVGRKPGESYVESWKMEPLGPAMLAAVTPPDVNVRFVDDRLEAIPYDEPTDAVGINVETYTARRAYSIAAHFRARGIPVILGGYHPTLAPEEAAPYADAIVEGQAERVWPRLVTDLRHGRLQTRYHGHGEPMPHGLHPCRDIFAGKKYLPVTLIETGRGCRAACEFCSVSPFFGRTATARPIEDVVAEIETVGNRSVFFVDDNIVADVDRAKRLFSALRASGIRWMSQGSITMATDAKLLQLMRQSGCQGILVGFESLSRKTLSSMGKSWNRANLEYEEAVRRIRDAGIAIYATFVFGYDTDDADSFDRTTEFALRHKFFLAAFNHLVPFPGTPLYHRLKRDNRLLSDPWWLDPGYRFGDVAFQPARMSAKELAERCYQARREFYRFGSIAARACDVKGNCGNLRAAATYLWLNFFSGREMRKRQGLPLGAGFDGGDRDGGHTSGLVLRNRQEEVVA